MIFTENYYADTATLTIMALLSGMVTDDLESAAKHAALITSQDLTAGEGHLITRLEELENNKWIKTKHIEINPDLLLDYWQKNPENAAELGDGKLFYEDYVVPEQKEVDKCKTIESLIDILGYDKFDELQGGLYIFFRVTNAEAIKQLVDDYLDKFEAGQLRMYSVNTPWLLRLQYHYLDDLIAAKSPHPGELISISDADFYGKNDEARHRFAIAESILSYARKGRITLDNIGMDFENLDEQNNGQFYSSFVVNTSSPRRSIAAQPKLLTNTSITVTLEDYDKHKGVLHIRGIGNIKISSSGSAFRPPDKSTNSRTGKMYDQCWLMACVFKNVNTIRNGATYSTITSVSTAYSQGISRRRIKNLVYEINCKATDQLGINNLIKVSHDKVFVNSSYL